MGSGYSDEEYIKIGCKIIPAVDYVYAVADMIIKVKESLAPEYKLIRKDQILYTYLHIAVNRTLPEELLKASAQPSHTKQSKALKADAGLDLGLNTHLGDLTCKPAGELFGIPTKTLF